MTRADEAAAVAALFGKLQHHRRKDLRMPALKLLEASRQLLGDAAPPDAVRELAVRLVVLLVRRFSGPPDLDKVRAALADAIGDVAVAELRRLQTLAQAADVALRALEHAGADAAPSPVPSAAGAEFGADLAVVNPWSDRRFAEEDRLIALLEGRTAAAATPAAPRWASADDEVAAAAAGLAATQLDDVVDRTYLRRVCEAYLPQLGETQQQEVAMALYQLIASDRSNDSLQSELLDLLGLDAFEAVERLLTHRATIVDAVAGALARMPAAADADTGGKRDARGSGPTPTFGAQVTIVTEAEKKLSKVRGVPDRGCGRGARSVHLSTDAGQPPLRAAGVLRLQLLRKEERRKRTDADGLGGDQARLLAALGFRDATEEIQARLEAASQKPLFAPSSAPAVQYPNVRAPDHVVGREGVAPAKVHCTPSPFPYALTAPGLHHWPVVGHGALRRAVPAAAGYAAPEREGLGGGDAAHLAARCRAAQRAAGGHHRL